MSSSSILWSFEHSFIFIPPRFYILYLFLVALIVRGFAYLNWFFVLCICYSMAQTRKSHALFFLALAQRGKRISQKHFRIICSIFAIFLNHSMIAFEFFEMGFPFWSRAYHGLSFLQSLCQFHIVPVNLLLSNWAAQCSIIFHTQLFSFCLCIHILQKPIFVVNLIDFGY